MKSRRKFARVQANGHNRVSLERHLNDRQTFEERRSAAVAEWQALVSYPTTSKSELQHGETSSL